MNNEKKLRRVINKGIKLFVKNKYDEALNNLIEETRLRYQIREMILESNIEELYSDNFLNESSEDVETDIHDNTGINTLKALLKNTNVLSTVRGVYKTLTTDDDQRKSFRAHIVKWVKDTLAPITLNDKAPDPVDTSIQAMAEEIDPLADGDVDIDVEEYETKPGDESKFFDVDDGSEKESPDKEDSEENEMGSIAGQDTTGRNKAEKVYPTIEKSIIDYYAELDNDEDQELFHDYLIANMKLYFDKWENEMNPNVLEPDSEYTDDQTTMNNQV